jgi:hypothetical protein
MNRFIDRLKIYFVAFFALAAVMVWGAHLIWIWPGKRCEANSMWWDWRTRTCAMPVPLHVFTGRNPDGTPREIVPEGPVAQAAPAAPAQP